MIIFKCSFRALRRGTSVSRKLCILESPVHLLNATNAVHRVKTGFISNTKIRGKLSDSGVKMESFNKKLNVYTRINVV